MMIFQSVYVQIRTNIYDSKVNNWLFSSQQQNNSNIQAHIITLKASKSTLLQKMKPKTSTPQRVSNLPLKMLFFSYFNNHQNLQLMSDCHNAINQKITTLSKTIEQNYQEISSIVSDDSLIQQKHSKKQSHHMMQVIEEEDYWATERSQEDKESLTERNRNLLVRKFNSMIGMLERSSERFGEIMFMYKNEIKEIAMDLTKEREVNVKLMKEREQSIKGVSKDIKQGRSSSISETKTKKPNSLVSVAAKPSTLKRSNPISKTSLLPKPASSLQQQSQDQQIRPPPKPFCQQCLIRQNQQAQKQKLNIQQKNKWRQLSTKITNLKNQLSKYEDQLIGNQAEITRLNEELRKKNQEDAKADSEDKKKIKTINTTLRGEKIVLENQIISLKKKLQQTTEQLTILQAQNQKLNIQKSNLQSTIKWHTNTIEDLRNNFSSGIKQQGELLTKYNQVKQQNLLLISQIANQEKYLEQFVENLKTVQNSFRQQVQTLTNRVNELQQIIEQKNQTIIKLKLGKHQLTQSKPYNDLSSTLVNNQLSISRQQRQLRCQTKQSTTSKRDTHLSGTIMSKTHKRQPLTTGYQNNENFEQNMIKVLNKKLAIKECEVQRLKHDNQILKAELEVYKELEG